jgi:hypothetical protein
MLKHLAGPFFTSGTAYATIADTLSREIYHASKNNLIWAGFAADFTRTLREPARLRDI